MKTKTETINTEDARKLSLLINTIAAIGTIQILALVIGVLNNV